MKIESMIKNAITYAKETFNIQSIFISHIPLERSFVLGKMVDAESKSMRVSRVLCIFDIGFEIVHTSVFFTSDTKYTVNHTIALNKESGFIVLYEFLRVSGSTVRNRLAVYTDEKYYDSIVNVARKMGIKMEFPLERLVSMVAESMEEGKALESLLQNKIVTTTDGDEFITGSFRYNAACIANVLGGTYLDYYCSEIAMDFGKDAMYNVMNRLKDLGIILKDDSE